MGVEMKVNKIARPNMEKVAPSGPVEHKDKIIFQEMMNEKRDQNQLSKLEEMLAKIDAQGKSLSEKQTISNLMEYKKMVKDFVGEAVEYGLKLEKQGGFRRGGRSRMFKIVKVIDEKLLDLTDEIIAKEKKGLDILKCVGEIQGLLVNIYA